MQSITDFLLTVIVFVLLTPGIIVRLPTKGSKWIVAIFHALVFSIVMYIIHNFLLTNLEGFIKASKKTEIQNAVNKCINSGKTSYRCWDNTCTNFQKQGIDYSECRRVVY